jgi:hypothetical protein
LTHAAVTVTAMLLGVAWQTGWLRTPPETLCHDVSLALLLLCLWSFWSWWQVTGSWFDPYSIFLGAANVFNAGQAFLEVFGLNRAGILDGEFSPETTLKTLYLVFLGLASLHLGALLSTESGLGYCSTLGGGQAGPAGDAAGAEGPRAAVRRVGWLLLFLSCGPAFLELRDAVEVVLSSGYYALYQQEAALGAARAGQQLLASFLVPAALFLLAGSKGAPGCLAVSALTIAANAACQLFLGFRYYAIMPVVAYLWLADRCIRRVPRVALFGTAAVLLLLVLPVISATREVRGQDRLSLDFLADAFTSMDSPAVSLVSEMGGSMKTVAYTIELVPERHSYDHGMEYGYGLLTVLPNLFWDVHPAITYPMPSTWLIWSVDPATAAQGGGLGYSFIAEAYFNFGWLGAPLVLCLIGFLFGKLLAWSLRPSGHALARLAMMASFASFFTFYAREDVVVVFRPLVWFAVAPYTLVLVLSNYRGWTRTASERRRAGVAAVLPAVPQSAVQRPPASEGAAS